MTMKSNHRFTKTCLLGSVALLALNCQQLLAQSDVMRPNILIIFTDDQGYGDLACFGSQTNKTPRVDQLAREGTRFKIGRAHV